MSRKPISIAVLMVLCALLLVAAGCGGKKKTESTTAPTATSAPPVVATDTTSTPPATTAASGGGGSTADCQSFAKAASQVGTQFSQALSGTGGADISQASKAFATLADKAPDAIKGDFQTINDAFAKMAGALKGVDLSGGKTPDAATLAKLQQLGTEIDQTKLTKAETDISTWVTQNCH
jgi:hypothetical protein